MDKLHGRFCQIFLLLARLNKVQEELLYYPYSVSISVGISVGVRKC